LSEIISVQEMQKALYRDIRLRRWPWITTNTKALGSEADMVGVTAGRLVTEFEIKRYRSDFKADFKKKEKHRLLKEGRHPANYFYYVCPAGMIQPEEVPPLYGLIWVEKLEPTRFALRTGRSNKEIYQIITKRVAKRLHPKKITDYGLVKLLTSTMYKYFQLFFEQE
jgi:hypothetical protein